MKDTGTIRNEERKSWKRNDTDNLGTVVTNELVGVQCANRAHENGTVCNPDFNLLLTIIVALSLSTESLLILTHQIVIVLLMNMYQLVHTN